MSVHDTLRKLRLVAPKIAPRTLQRCSSRAASSPVVASSAVFAGPAAGPAAGVCDVPVPLSPDVLPEGESAWHYAELYNGVSEVMADIGMTPDQFQTGKMYLIFHERDLMHRDSRSTPLAIFEHDPVPGLQGIEIIVAANHLASRQMVDVFEKLGRQDARCRATYICTSPVDPVTGKVTWLDGKNMSACFSGNIKKDVPWHAAVEQEAAGWRPVRDWTGLFPCSQPSQPVDYLKHTREMSGHSSKSSGPVC